MIERLALVAAITLAVLGAALLIRAWNARRVRALQTTGPNWSALGTQPDGRATLIAFSTPSCAACHQAQSPAIEVALSKLGEHLVRVITVNAASESGAARAFGILTVPATVVVAAGGEHIIAVNQGFAPSARLVQQLQLAA
jgi:thioredoxin family protein